MSQEQIVFLTGATGKLGQEIAQGFSLDGATIVFTARSRVSAEELKVFCMQKGAKRVEALLIDLLAKDSVTEIVSELNRLSLFPTVLVNNARNVEYLRHSQGLISRENWLGELALDVVVPYELSMALATSNSALRKIINISSIYGITAPNLRLYESSHDSPINYGVAKAALIHLTKELAVRLADKNIQVNAVSYGGVSGRATESFVEKYSLLCPASCMLSDSDIFEPIKLLASQNFSGMTGHNLVVDGGWTVW